MKKKRWLKRPKAVPQKTKFGPKYKLFKISYLKLFFWKYFFEHKTFYIRPHVPLQHYQSSFFNLRFFSRKSQSQQKLPKKITHFTIQFRSKNLYSHDIENDMLLQHSKKPSWIYQKFFSKHVSVWCQKKHLHSTVSWRPKLHSWSTLKANVRLFLYISVRKDAVKFLSDGGGWVGGRLNNFIKATRFLGLVKCFTIFILIEIFVNSTIFPHFHTSIYCIKTLKFSR